MIQRKASQAPDPGGIGPQVLAGLLGRGIQESRTPWMQEQEGVAQGLRFTYALFDFTERGWTDAELPQALDAVQRLGFSGVNVTLPFKQAVIPLLDDLSTGARAIGAVNTIAFAHGRRIGHNTDVTGFAASFEQGLSDAARRLVLQLGCGGAGAATAHALLGSLEAERLILYDPDPGRATALAGQLLVQFGSGRVDISSDPAAAALAADGIVNASPVGMAKFPGLPLPADAILPRHWVADIVYFPLETAFLAHARARGCRVLDGSGMAVRQATESFKIFTGLEADVDRVMASFTAFRARI